MRRFLYYLPGIRGLNVAMLRERGVADRFTDRHNQVVRWSVTEVDEGPAGSGCIVCDDSAPPRLAFADQRWVEGKNFWLAAERDDPRPQDLEREVGIAGHEVVLGDRHPWRIPLIRRWDRATLQHVSNLPTSLSATFEGGKHRYRPQVRPEFAAIDALAERTFAGFVAEKSLSIEEWFPDVVALLGVNYRIGLEEIAWLGLFPVRETSPGEFTAEEALNALCLSIDLPSLTHQAAELQSRGLQYVEPVIEPEE